MSRTPRRNFRRQPVTAPARQAYKVKTFPAPTKGLILNENVTVETKLGAQILKNAVCTETGVRMRKGSPLHATIGSGTQVESLFAYRSATNKVMFAANNTSIYDISSPADAEVSPSAAVAGQNDGVYSTQNFETTGGHYLYALNSLDSPQLFDGSTWQAVTAASTPISMTGKTTSLLGGVWAYKNRLFFVETNTLRAWYLPVDVVGGALNSISLAGVFTEGGALLFGADWSWSSETGDMQSRCVFVSTEGEVAIYAGSDPSDASDWGLVGVYKMGKPLGQHAIMQAGGDLLIATVDGLIPLTAAISKDPAALEIFAVSSNIEPVWKELSLARLGHKWNILKWSERGYALVAVPRIGSTIAAKNYVVNLKTGAWSEFTGWETDCTVLHESRGFFGTSDGTIYEMEVGGTDNGSEFVFTCLFSSNSFSKPGFWKQFHMANASFKARRPFNAKLTALENYSQTTPAAPSSPNAIDYGVWDIGLWDNAVWDSGLIEGITTNWVSIGRSAQEISPLVMIASGSDGAGGNPSLTPDVELLNMNVLYEVGGIVV